MRGITRDTVSEALDRKVLFVFGGVTLIFAIIAILLRNMEINIQMDDEVSQGLFISTFTQIVVRALSSFLTFLFFIAIMSTAGIIPNMFVRGRAEYYLSKPVSRKGLLLSKFFSIWLVYGGAVLLCGAIGLAVIYFAHDIFEWPMVWIFVTEYVSFFIWMSIVLLGGVVFGSYTMGLVSAFVIWVAQVIIGFGQQFREMISSGVLRFAIDAFYYILPKTGEITDIGDSLALGKSVESWMPLYSSLIFAVVLIIISVVSFQRRDY